MEHFIDRSISTSRWNNLQEPRLTINSGDEIVFEMRDASDGQVKKGMTGEEFSKIDTTRIHGLTGPVNIHGASPGDTLQIDILEYEHEGWAWTSIIPGLGLLENRFEKHHLHHWELDGKITKSIRGVTLDLNPFCGIIGVQRTDEGEFRTRPPGPWGGNMDVKHLTAGTSLFLPVFTEGAGLCAGDSHAAQGDGEVCINGMEAPMKARFKVTVHKGKKITAPYAITPGQQISSRYTAKPFHTFIESDEDPRFACQRVVERAMVYIEGRLGIPSSLAYILCSVVLDLKVSQLVNVPMTTISGYLPEAIFDKPI